MSKEKITDGQCWAYIFDAFGGERSTPPAVDRHTELADAIRRAYADGVLAGKQSVADPLRVAAEAVYSITWVHGSGGCDGHVSIVYRDCPAMRSGVIEAFNGDVLGATVRAIERAAKESQLLRRPA